MCEPGAPRWQLCLTRCQLAWSSGWFAVGQERVAEGLLGGMGEERAVPQAACLGGHSFRNREGVSTSRDTSPGNLCAGLLASLTLWGVAGYYAEEFVVGLSTGL